MKNFKPLRVITIFVFIILSLRCNNKPGATKNKSLQVSYELVKDWPQLLPGYQLGQPTGIGIDTSGHIFIFHRAGRRWTEPFPDSAISFPTILELDNETGKILNSWGANLFIMPHGLTVDKHNNIWVTDVGLHQVLKFSHDGRLLIKWGVPKVPGNDSLHFNLPTDVAIANDGSFYVSDGYGNSRVVKFSATGKYLFTWGSHGNKPGEFNIPHAITLDDKGNVYVADRENNRIQVFDSTGAFIKEIMNNEKVAQIPAITLDNSQHLFAVDYDFKDSIVNGSTIFRYDSSGKVFLKFSDAGTNKRAVAWFHDISVDKDGNVYAGDIHNMRVLKFKLK
ncbi:MAG: 6-bladed beta-propeller [Chitinophagaceae bacterium]|nr:MAG: 6-bladed beta-propeller [Chitinophagaceae bacterium]